MENRNLSYWNKTAEKTAYPPLKRDLETDILIIGGGISGVTCAYCLAKKGISSVLLEAGDLCDGTTGNTTGKVTIQHGIIYSGIARKYGDEAAALYAESQNSALNFVKDAVNHENIDCQLMCNTAYVYASTIDDRSLVEKEYETAKRLGIEAEMIIKPGFPAGNFGMLGFKDQLVFHPVRYVTALAKSAVARGAKIHCSTKAVKVEDGDIKTVYCENNITVKARHLVMATQYPIYDGPNLFFARLYAKRSYGVAVRPKKNWPEGSFINTGEPTRSIRTHMENGAPVLIVVGENHATGRGEEDMEKHFERLITFASDIAGVDEVLARWSAQDYDTPDQVPYIGRISDGSNIYVASGYGKWGLSNGTLAGMMISDLISSGNCNYEGLYSRSRSDILTSPLKTIAEVFTPIGELIKSKLEGTEDLSGLQRGEGRVIRFEGQKAGIYRDFDDRVTIIDITCTHMKTELNFNSAEKTWDCPAHGGRYNTEGKLLEGPPKHNLEILYQGRFEDLIDKN
jgi:glycine/D-amino acid oxidase-like deaminating enzyme/nitrite reductase/ring-hydroxylating ferredoxin subunit